VTPGGFEWRHRPACDQALLAGEIDRTPVTDETPGIAVFDHPANPRHPTHWRCMLEPGFGFVNAALVHAEPYVMPVGDSLALRYRVLVHPGWGEPSALEDEWERFAPATGTPARPGASPPRSGRSARTPLLPVRTGSGS